VNLGSRPPAPRPIVAWPGLRPIVWAPSARTVELGALSPDGPTRSPMRLSGAHDPGYWGADREMEPGTVYGFSIDGGEPVTDPLATCLPQGIDGLSCAPGDVQPPGGWSDAGWQPPPLAAGVLLHLDIENLTPEGTFEAAAALLPRIARSGVQGVELAPVATYDDDASPADGVRIFSVHARLGGSTGLATFVDAAHAAGLAVVLTPAFRWAVAPRLGLEAFGPYAAGERINLEGSGSRGARDFLIANAEWWFERFHVDGLALDIEALAHHSSVPFLSALADATVAFSEVFGRRLMLFVDGPGRSDRLTNALRRLLSPGGGPPAAFTELQRLSRDLTPSTRLPLRADRLVCRAPRTTSRAASLVIGDLTRLAGARRAMPWVPADEVADPADLDTRASTLTVAWLAGTPLVLDTDHVPVTEDSPEARRLLEWNATLAGLRAEITARVALGVEVRAGESALALRRGDFAVVLAWGPHDPGVDLSALLHGDPAGWELVAAWSPDAAIEDGTLRIPVCTTAVLRARP